MTEFMDPDHEAMGDAAGDLIDPTLDKGVTNTRPSAEADWDPRPPGATDPKHDADENTDPNGGGN